MPALITELIDKTDAVELISLQIAAILKLESDAQQVLATAESKDPRLWALRVFHERSDPWPHFQDAPESSLDATPIVNVWFENYTIDAAASDVVQRQKYLGTFNVDVYGYGSSEATDTGHVAGDEAAAAACKRALKLVRNILMASHHTYLGMRGTVVRRWPTSVAAFQPQIDGQYVQNIVAARMALQVDFYETSPQVQGEVVELIATTVKRAETGEIYFTAEYEHGADS